MAENWGLGGYITADHYTHCPYQHVATSALRLFASMKELSSFVHPKRAAYVDQIVKQIICT